MNTLLNVGTRIRFTQDLEGSATEDRPACLYARKGELGTITGHGCSEGYWVKTDSWPHAFGCAPEEFEVVPATRLPTVPCVECQGTGLAAILGEDGVQTGVESCRFCRGTRKK